MPTKFATVELPVPSGTGLKVVQRSTENLNGPVERADCALKGFKFDYEGENVDHQMNVVEVASSCSITGPHRNFVSVRVVCQYADRNFDDKYTGHVSVLVTYVV